MLVAGLVCFWLASYLTKPISRLRRLTRRFADGDLQARVENHSAFRHSEELQGLAHDFDRMAEQIQGLIERQKHLLWDVSHELRTPLTRIALAIGLMRQRLATAPPKELNRIDREIERLNRLIGQILTIARLDAGTRVEHRCDLDLSALVDEITEQARLEADARDITIQVDCEPSVHMFGSVELLRMAIENVLRNAIRHTPQTSTVTIQVRGFEGQASLSICDQGPGVEVSDLGRMFDPFFRSEDARLNHPGGTGLGLALARRVVGCHGGSIRAFNQAHGGLVVQILLPTEASSSLDRERSLALATSD
jgi:two-component system, OmpR family, sensor histidine kinase CpxA